MKYLINARGRGRVNWLTAVALLIAGSVASVEGPQVAAYGAGNGVQFGVPVVSGATDLSKVSCPSSTDCVAVGYDNSYSEDVSMGTESAGVWTWSFSKVAFDASGGGALNSVSCANTSTCIAVGNDANTQAIYSIGTLSSSSGTWTWSQSTVIPPDASTEGELFGVSCPSATVCMAIGTDAGGNSIYAVGSISNTVVTWSPSTIVNSGTVGPVQFSSVSCQSVTVCVAVGQGTAGNNQAVFSAGTFASGAWSWIPAKVITADSTNQTFVRDVSCSSMTSCVAIGWDGNSQPIFTAGSFISGAWTWSTAAELPFSTPNSGYLKGISCGGPSTCVAVGESQRTQGISATASFASGTWTWTPLGTITSDISGYESLEGVSCASASSCVAVGQNGNLRGTSSASIILPGAPSIGTATSAYTAVNVTWTTGNAGGGTIAGYTVDAFDASTSVSTSNACPSSTTSTSMSCVVSGLTEGDLYTFTVAANNEVGQGPFSNPSDVASPARTAPEPPTNVTATLSGSSATVSWSPGPDNGSSIQGYVVLANSSATQFPGAHVCPSSQTSIATSCTISNLANGSTFSFAVESINAVGTSYESRPSNDVSVSTSPFNGQQSPLTIASTVGPAFDGASSSSLSLTTSGGSVSGLDAYAVGGANLMSVINTATNTVIGNVDVGNLGFFPSSIAVNSAGTFVYVSYQNSNNVVVIDTTTQSVVATIPVGNAPTDIVVNPAGTYAYVTNSSSGTVSVIDLHTNTVSSVLQVGNDPTKIILNPAGTQAIVVGSIDVSIINTTDLSMTQVTLPAVSRSLALNPQGTTAYAISGMNQLSVINVANHSITASVTVGVDPSLVVVNPAGTFAYVVNNGNGTGGPGAVSVISTSTNAIVNSIAIRGATFPGINAFAIDPTGTYGFLEGGQVVNLNTGSVVTTIQGGLGVNIYFNQSGTLAYGAGGSIAYFDVAALTNVPAISGPFGFIYAASQPSFIAFSTPATSYVTVDGTATGCSVDGSILTANAPGTCLVTATMAGDHSYGPVSSAQTAISFPASGSGSGSGSGGGGGSGSVPPPVVISPTPPLPSPPTSPNVPSKPTPREVTYSANGTSLSSSAKNVLDALAKRLESGASVTVTGYARGNASLAEKRAMVVASYLENKVHVHVTVKIVTTSTANKVMITTMKQ